MLLDLFCGGGGAGSGYARAGFRVVGVDNEFQPHYPYEFHQADALEFLARYGRGFDVVHASPPCQAHSNLARINDARGTARERVDLLPQTRAALIANGRPYVIENVHTRSAGLVDPLVLCGSMFGLGVYRHRGFESSVTLVPPDIHRPHRYRVTPMGHSLPTPERPIMTVTGRNGHRGRAWVAAAAAAMDTPWLSTSLNQVCEAIPPAYTEWIGAQLLTGARR